MTGLHDLIRREPAVVTGLVVAVLNLVVAFGLPLTGEQREAIVALTSTLLVVVGAFVVRQRVTPVDP